MHLTLDGDNWCCRGGLADCMSSAKWLGPVEFIRSVPEGDVLWQVCKFSKVSVKRAWQDDSTPLLLLPSKFFKKDRLFFFNLRMDMDTRWNTFPAIPRPHNFTVNKVEYLFETDDWIIKQVVLNHLWKREMKMRWRRVCKIKHPLSINVKNDQNDFFLKNS